MSDKPKLTYAIQYFDETGTMRAPYLICKGFLHSDWNTEIITIASAKNVNIKAVWDAVPVHKVMGATKKISIIKLALKFLGPRENRVVMATIWDWHCFTLMISKIVFGAPYVIRLDSYIHKFTQGFLSRLWEGVRYGFIMNWADIILAETPISFDQARKHTKRSEVLLITPGFWLEDLQKTEKQWDQEEYVSSREFTILFAGRLVERKNIHDLIQAFSRLAPRFPEWRLEIRGPVTSATYYEKLQALINSLGVRERVEFKSSLSGIALYRRYRETAIYCLPSTGEGMPTTITEAMYFGGAIVAGNSGGVAYQLDNGNCGLLHQPGDVETLTAHLDRLMGSPTEREQLMAKAKARMIDVFAWENYFPMLEKKFRDLVNAETLTTKSQLES